MTTHALDGVPLLIPARFYRARERAVQAVLSDLSACLAELPTAFRSGSLADADTDTAKAWARDVIRALPTQKGVDNDGSC